MSDLPQNERFSAYLDGELTADEQAEMDRLLAVDPEAKRLLDELRAVGEAIRSLPREELGRDLRDDVLAAAERRMLTGDGPENVEASAWTPRSLAQTIAGRFLTRRNLIWLSLTAAVAVAVVVHERRQQTPWANRDGREVARAPARSDQNRPAETRDAPPTIQAVRQADARSSDGPRASTFAQEAGSPTLRERGEQKSSFAAPAEIAAKPAAKAKRVAKTATQRPASPPPNDEADRIVHCDATAKAVQKKALEKLLDANGVAWRRRGTLQKERSKSQEGATVGGAAKPGESQAREDLKDGAEAEAPERKNAAGSPPTDAPAAEKTKPSEIVYIVEGTPAQIEAVLAALAAKPDVFSAIRTGRGEPRRESEAEKTKSQSATPHSPVEKKDRAAASSRVLFVLHVVGGDHRVKAGDAAAGEEKKAAAADETGSKTKTDH